MTHQPSMTRGANWPRVWQVDDPSLIDLSDSFTAIELFVDDPDDGFYHIFRYILDSEQDGVRVISEGILLGQSRSDARPELHLWSGGSDELKVLSCIDLGRETYQQGSDAPTDMINEDPIVFVNFDPETTTARFVRELAHVPELVRARHLGSLREHAKAS